MVEWPTHKAGCDCLACLAERDDVRFDMEAAISRNSALLREVEWAECGDCSRCKTCRGWNAKCPVCLECKVCGHAPDCQLAAALEKP